jgi:hypothetical protein
VDSSGLVQRPRAGSYEHGNGSSDPPNSDNLTTYATICPSVRSPPHVDTVLTLPKSAEDDIT